MSAKTPPLIGTQPNAVPLSLNRHWAIGHLGTPNQELTLLVGLLALNVAMFASCFLVLWGLRGEGPPRPGSRSPC